MSSHDVVYRVRRATGEGRVGHAGTLDPAASGVLVVGIGQGARLLGLLTLETKAYVASIRFGAETDTDDAEGALTRTAEVPAELASHEFAARAVAGLVGEFDQLPPAYSAISVNGRRAYEAARAGEELELAPRHVKVLEAQLLGVQEVEGAPEWLVALTVSKGCYVRSIARDLGRSLGTAAHLVQLTRTASGCVGLGECVSLELLAAGGKELVLERALDPVRLLGLPARIISEREAADVAHGKRIPLGVLENLPEGADACLVRDGGLVGIWHRSGQDLVCTKNFPTPIKGANA